MIAFFWRNNFKVSLAVTSANEFQVGRRYFKCISINYIVGIKFSFVLIVGRFQRVVIIIESNKRKLNDLMPQNVHIRHYRYWRPIWIFDRTHYSSDISDKCRAIQAVDSSGCFLPGANHDILRE